jgi:cytochrome P450
MRVSMPIYSIHRNPKYWEEPERFMPSRFDTRVNPPVSAYSYIPFSIGRRSCLGNRFAQVNAPRSVPSSWFSWSPVSAG